MMLIINKQTNSETFGPILTGFSHADTFFFTGNLLYYFNKKETHIFVEFYANNVTTATRLVIRLLISSMFLNQPTKSNVK